MRFVAAALAALALDSSIVAQAPKDVPLDTAYLREHAQTRGFLLGRPMRPQPTPDGKAVVFLRSGPRSAKLALYEFDVAGKTTRELLTPEQALKGADEKLSPEEKAARERMRISVGGFTAFQLAEDGSRILLEPLGQAVPVHPCRWVDSAAAHRRGHRPRSQVLAGRRSCLLCKRSRRLLCQHRDQSRAAHYDGWFSARFTWDG